MPRLSWTQINMFGRCGLQYLYRYVQGERRPPGVALLVGSGTHEGVEASLVHKLSGAPATLEQVQEAARDGVRRRFADEVVLTDDEHALGRDKVAGAAIDTAARLAGLYHEEVTPTREPLAVERPWEIDLGGGVTVSGVTDLVCADAIDDLKTAGKAPGADAIRTPQLALNQLAIQTIDGQAPERVRLVTLTKTARPKVVTQEATIGDRERAAVVTRIEAVAAAIKAGVFVPADPTSWTCTPKFCGWWDRCPHGAAQAVSATVPVAVDSPEAVAFGDE